MIDILEKKHNILVTEFDLYVIEHLILQIKDDEEYNLWSRYLAYGHRQKGQSVVYITIKALKPAKSRLVEHEVTIDEDLA